jgi:phosphoribosyl 1,2-cyclic phosphate phosphodiesterase
VHLSIPEALAVITEVGPERAYITHLSHDVPHAATSETLPAGVELAYDGLVVEVSDD